jgi:hypothetical protein
MAAKKLDYRLGIRVLYSLMLAFHIPPRTCPLPVTRALVDIAAPGVHVERNSAAVESQVHLCCLICLLILTGGCALTQEFEDVVSSRSTLLPRTPARPTGSRSRAGTAAPPGAPVSCCRRACILVPRAAVGVQKLEDVEVPVPRHHLAHLLVPRATVRMQEFEDVEMPVLRRLRARFLVPRAPAGM